MNCDNSHTVTHYRVNGCHGWTELISQI